MSFPYERYESLPGTPAIFYPAGQEALAQRVQHEVALASKLLGDLLQQRQPEIELAILPPADWQFAPPDNEDESGAPTTMLPYWTNVPHPSMLVIPESMDGIIGESTSEKLALLLYHEVAHAFIETDDRPWPSDSPLWADEWPLQFAAFWAFQQVNGAINHITDDLHQQFAASFEPEADGKTPVTVRGFDWYEDTSPEDYLEFVLLLEKFATDLLARNDATILPRFLDRYRQEAALLSDEVTLMLADILGAGGEAWLEALVYF